MKITKRFIALILCAIMMLSVTTGAFAQTDETDGEDSTIVVNETESEIETEEEEKSDSEESEGVLCSCILEEGEHQEGCQHYVALEKNSLYENLMSYTVFEEFYTAFLEYVNNEETMEMVFELTTEQIFELIEKMEILYAEIDEVDEQMEQDKEDFLLSMSFMPNYREKCTECEKFPCVCDLAFECICEAKEGEEHSKECPMYYAKIYDALMLATNVDEFGEVSCTLNEIETSELRQWLDKNSLLEKFNKHMDNLFQGAPVGETYPMRKSSWSSGRSSTNIEDALKMNKTATYNTSTGKYDIMLEAYTTGIVEEGQVLPADTVLVLDTSGSMAYTYNSTRIGTPMYGDYFQHPSGKYWGWYENTHLINGKNPYVLLPDGTFAEAQYTTTDANNVEIFTVVKSGSIYNGTKFYPHMQTENLTTVPRVYGNYPVYQLYSSISSESYTVKTGVPIFGSQFTYNNVVYYGWLQNSHGEPYVKLEDGTFVRVDYSRTDGKSVEIFKYTDVDTGDVYEFYPRLTEKYNNVTRAENLPIVQLYSGSSTTRMAALHEAVAEFLRLTADRNKGMSASAQSRVSIVQFSCDQHGGTAPTKVLKNLTAITIDNVDEWIAFTYGITDGGGSTHTEIGEGMLLAEDIIESAGRTSFKAVLAFTDGKPECDATSGGGYSFIEADKAVAAANRITQDHDGVVYSVCIQEHAAVNAGHALPPREGKGVNDDKNNVNRLMHLLSNNYPNASDMNTTGSGSTSEGYYMVPGGDGDLVSIFTQIGDQIGSAMINMDATATVVDYVTPYFTVPENVDDIDISIMDAKYSGSTLSWTNSSMDTSGISYTVNKDDKSVRVSGFDYNHNFVASTGRVEGNIAEAGNFYGRKLVIQFSINPNSDFLGGDDVVTNEAKSGIYMGTTEVARFEVPKVDIKVSTITPEVVSKDIYVSQQISVNDIIKVGEYSKNGKKWTVDGINNAYVDIVYKVIDSDGKTMTYTIPAGTASLEDIEWTGSVDTEPLLKKDMTYKVTCTVTSKNDTTNKSISNEVKSQVNVYKPEMTFKDSAINLGEIANYEKDNFVNVVWKHGTTEAIVSTMGTAPTLKYDYTPAVSDFKEDTDVLVTVTSKSNGSSVPEDQNITQYVTFYRDMCDYKDCDHKEKNTVSSTDAQRINFVVHIKDFDLRITKDVDGTLEEANQSFVFKITGENNFSMDVVIVGENSVTIKGLPAGEYTVQELTDWSWRYNCTDGVTKKVSAADAEEGVTSVIFTNKLNEGKWLSGDSYCENWWGGDDGAVIRRDGNN